MNLHPTMLPALATVLLSTPAMASGVDDFDKSMNPVLQQYLAVQTALSGDSMAGTRVAAERMVALTAKLDGSKVKGQHAQHYRELPAKLRHAAAGVAKATTLEGVREAFRQLSKPMAMWGTMSKPAGVDVVFCSMAKGSWLQKSGGIKNPYYGASMLACGEVVGGAAHSAATRNHGGH